VTTANASKRRTLTAFSRNVPAIGVAGNGFNQLNAPYDAKVVEQYVGLTPPPHGH
jgi:hypothetical protein